jgi:predicted cupin superfamily sugar epimerase
MDRRASDLIATLGLIPHPEGGYFREIHRSVSQVQPLDGRSARAALTTIYFLLAAGQVSRWHRVASDEVWHHYEGGDLELFTVTADLERTGTLALGASAAGSQPVHVVPATMWQAARPMGAYALVGCTVGPGFEFADFQMLRDLPDAAEHVSRCYPVLSEFL